jgi:hypothetical protein
MTYGNRAGDGLSVEKNQPPLTDAPMSAAVDAETIEGLKVVMGDEGFSKLIDLFRQEAPRAIEAIRKSHREGNGDALHRTAHRFKGASGTMGAMVLSGLCRELELLAKNGELEKCEDTIRRIESEYVKVKVWFHELSRAA